MGKFRDKETGAIYQLPDGIPNEEVDAFIASGQAEVVQPPQSQAEPVVSKAQSAGMGALQGGSFGFADELLGGFAAAGIGQSREQLAKYGQEPERGAEGEAYTYARDQAREADDLARRANPKTYFAGELAGGIAAPGGATFQGARALGNVSRTGGRIADTVSRLGPLSRTSLAGAGAGATAGLGYSTAEDAGGMAVDTAIGAGIGAVAAPVTGLALRGINYGYQGGKNALERAIFGGDEEFAERRVRGLLESEGLTSPGQTRQAVEELGPDGQLGDVLPYESEGISQMPGAGGRIVRDATTERQAGQQDRLKNAATEELQPIWDDYHRFLDDIDTQKRAQATPLYEEANRVGFKMTDNLVRLFEKPAVKKALKKAHSTVMDELDSPLTGLQAPTDATMSLQMVDETLKTLGDQIQTALVKKPARARQLIRLKKAIEAEIYEQNPAYQQARGVWAGAKQLERAAEEGRSLLQGTRLYDVDIQARLREMSASEADSMRVGLIRGIADRVESASGTGNAVGRLAGNTRMRGILREAFGSEEAAENFLQAVDNETVMNLTYGLTRTGSGSRTARAMAQRSGDVGVDNMVGYGAASGEPGMMFVGAIKSIWRGITGNDDMTESQGREVAELLFGGLDDETLDRIYRRRAAQAARELGLDEQIPAQLGGAAGSLLTEGAVE